MDNRRTIPGYKYYVDAATGTRPSVYVAFLDVRPSPGDAVNGLVFAVTSSDLAALDARERNYRRIEVTDAIEPRHAPGRIWTYVGAADARARRERGLAGGTLLVSGEYAALVVAGFAAIGPHELARYRASTDDPPCPVANLRRIDLPPA
jgi:dephospho-CoA kinase